MRNQYLYLIYCIYFISALIDIGPAAEEKWKWKEELSEPSYSSLSTGASVKSYSKEICKDKAMVQAGDKMQLQVSDLLKKFLEKENIPTVLEESDREKYRKILVNAEILMMEKMKTFKLGRSEVKDGYNCDITLTIDLFNVLSAIEAASSVDSIVNEHITNSKLFKQLQARAQEE